MRVASTLYRLIARDVVALYCRFLTMLSNLCNTLSASKPPPFLLFSSLPALPAWPSLSAWMDVCISPLHRTIKKPNLIQRLGSAEWMEAGQKQLMLIGLRPIADSSCIITLFDYAVVAGKNILYSILFCSPHRYFTVTLPSHLGGGSACGAGGWLETMISL